MQKIPTLFLRGEDGLVIDEINPRADSVKHPRAVATRKYDGTCCLWLNGQLYKRHEVKPGKPVPEGFHQFGFPLSHAQVLYEAEPASASLKARTAAIRENWHLEVTEEPSKNKEGPFGDQGPVIRQKLIGWIPVGSGPEDQYHNEALRNVSGGCVLVKKENLSTLENKQTYELCGPKIQGNPENLSEHTLIKHGCCKLLAVPIDYERIKNYLAQMDIEGIVWHFRDSVEGEQGERLNTAICKIKKKDFGMRREQRCLSE